MTIQRFSKGFSETELPALLEERNRLVSLLKRQKYSVENTTFKIEQPDFTHHSILISGFRENEEVHYSLTITIVKLKSSKRKGGNADDVVTDSEI